MSPANAQVTLQEALTHHRAGRLERATTLYAQVYRAQPKNFDGLHLGGLATLQLGNPTQAIELLGKALRINPNSSLTLMGLGIAQAQLGKRTEAEASLRKAIKLDPRSHEAWSNLGSLLMPANRLEEAEACFRKTVELQPSFAQGWTALGSVLQLQSRSIEAIEHHTRALKLDPAHPKAQLARAQAYQSLHDTDRALADFEGHLIRQPGDHEAQSYRLFLFNYSATLSRKTLFDEHVAFGRRFPSPGSTAVTPKPTAADRDRKLRVGFLSPDLRSHSVAYFLEPLLRHLDRNAFEIFLYHDHFVEDSTSARLRGLAAQWRNFIGQSTDAVEQQLRTDRPDILIDLSGHSGLNRMPVFARRVATVQVAYLGYPNTTGLKTMDFRFTDSVADPERESEAQHTEKLVRFSNVAWAYSPPHDAPAIQLPSSRAGQPITFGSFNNASKVNAFTLRLWAEVLRATPGSRLMIKSFGLEAQLMNPRLTAAGLDPSRVLVVPATASVAEHLACYHRVDIALDPFPYHGTTTTCEALWMGVPVVTLRGDRHASRVGTSLLSAIGHPEWIANDAETYIKIATTLAANPDLLADRRQTLRPTMERSLLLNHAAQAASFGQALRACWQSACGQAVNT